MNIREITTFNENEFSGLQTQEADKLKKQFKTTFNLDVDVIPTISDNGCGYTLVLMEGNKPYVDKKGDRAIMMMVRFPEFPELIGKLKTGNNNKKVYIEIGENLQELILRLQDCYRGKRDTKSIKIKRDGVELQVEFD